VFKGNIANFSFYCPLFFCVSLSPPSIPHLSPTICLCIFVCEIFSNTHLIHSEHLTWNWLRRWLLLIRQQFFISLSFKCCFWRMPVLLVCSVTDTPGINIPSRCHRGKGILFLGVGNYCLNMIGTIAFVSLFIGLQ
jgi:hypothetical protein